MLKDDFFTITTLGVDTDSFMATLELNEKHAIFNGHFPGQPVVPGVCMMQMVKEVTETALGKKMMLTKAEELKFLQLTNPTENKTLELLLHFRMEENGKINFTASLSKENSVCFKFRGHFSLTK